jgi:hypothetical protein
MSNVPYEQQPTFDVPVTIIHNVKVIAADVPTATATVTAMSNADIMVRGDITSVSVGTPVPE